MTILFGPIEKRKKKKKKKKDFFTPVSISRDVRYADLQNVGLSRFWSIKLGYRIHLNVVLLRPLINYKINQKYIVCINAIVGPVLCFCHWVSNVSSLTLSRPCENKIRLP